MHLDYPMMVPHAFFINVYINIHPMLKFNFTQCHITKGETSFVPHASRNIHNLLKPTNVIDPETELRPMLFDKKWNPNQCQTKNYSTQYVPRTNRILCNSIISPNGCIITSPNVIWKTSKHPPNVT
jgi:hypothetical protein